MRWYVVTFGYLISWWALVEFYTPLKFSGLAEDRIVKFCARVGPRSISLLMTNYPPKSAWSRSRDILIFGKWVLMSQKRRKTEIYLQWKTNKRSYMAYQMAAKALTVTLNGLEGLQAFSNAMRRTFMQHFTRFQLTVCSQWRRDGVCRPGKTSVLPYTYIYGIRTYSFNSRLTDCNCVT